MKGFAYLTFLVWAAALIAGCGPKQIEPGDKVAGFLVTQAEDRDVSYQWDLGCKKKADAESYSCKAEVGKNVNVSVGIYASLSGKDLDTVWKGHSYELYINDLPVNLKSFGYIEIMHPRVGPMRVWNVVIVGDKPGEITIRDKGVVDGDPIESTTTLAFSAPDQ
jgi:hypothetical protein